jgi:cytochrome c biogenesis protein CcmG, thiol:disulfide interchange protein DsbE
MTRSSPPTTRRRATKPNRTPIFVLAAVVAAVVVALVVALAVGGNGDDTASNTGNGDPATTGTVTVSGEALPAFSATADDPAVGQTLPTLEGHDQSGAPMTISGDGRPTMIMFVAHWCPHCQREVPVVQHWVDDGRLPQGVDLVSVSTAIDPNRPNYPPDAWLADEGWTAPVLVDADNSAAQAVGLSAYPFFVAIDGEGRVVLRASGELTTDQLDAIASSLTQGADQ